MKFRAILSDKDEIAERKNFHLKSWQKNLIYFAVFIVVINILAVIYVTKSSYIYFWDSATYWDISRKIAVGELNEGGFWSNIYNSIASMDYNYIAGLPSAVLVKLFGESRLVYVLGLVNMYLVPSFIMIYVLARKVSKAPKISAALCMLLCPALTFMAFIGFVDIGGVLICLICFNLYYTKKGDEPQLWKYIIIGAMLVMTVLWRRYYAFFAVSFITAMLADAVLFKRKWYKAVSCAVVAGLILVVFFRDFLTERLLVDYGNLYSGYKFELSTDLKLAARYFGIIYVLVLAVGSVAAAIKHKETRTAFMWTQMLVWFVMFVSTQTHGQQHLMLYIPSLIMLTLIMIKHITKEWMLLGMSFLALINTISVYIPRTQLGNIQEISHMAFIPDFSMLSLQRSDSMEILELKQKLDKTVYEGDTLGVVSSSFTLNEDVLKNVEASLGVEKTRDDYIITVPQIDSRDKDMTALYKANYLLIASPPQTHLAEGNQIVVEETVKSFEDGTDISAAYEEIYDFETVIGDITVKLYHRIGEEKHSDITAFESRLRK